MIATVVHQAPKPHWGVLIYFSLLYFISHMGSLTQSYPLYFLNIPLLTLLLLSVATCSFYGFFLSHLKVYWNLLVNQCQSTLAKSQHVHTHTHMHFRLLILSSEGTSNLYLIRFLLFLKIFNGNPSRFLQMVHETLLMSPLGLSSFLFWLRNNKLIA